MSEKRQDQVRQDLHVHRGPRKVREEARSAGMAKSSDVEIGDWGKRFGRERTYPERAEICSDIREKKIKISA